MLLRARAFGGSMLLTLAGDQLNKKGENLANSYNTKLTLNAAGVDLQAGAAYFKAPAVPVQKLGWLKVVFAGEPERPKTWQGEAGVRVETLVFGKATVDSAEVDTTFAAGVANVTYARVESGTAGLTLQAQANLPESINDFSKTEGDATFHIGIASLDEATKAFLPQSIRGHVDGRR